MLRLHTCEHLQEGTTLALSKPMLAHIAAYRCHTFVLFNEQQGSFHAILTKNKQALIGSLVELPVKTRPLTLAIATIKPKRMTLVLEKCTELGVTTFQPIITEFSQKYHINTERSLTICKNALEQSQRYTLPEVLNPISLTSFLASSQATFYVAMERTEKKTWPRAIHEPAHIIIGPEGGFSEAERSLFLEKKSCIPFSLGSHILRSETAAIASIALFTHHYA